MFVAPLWRGELAHHRIGCPTACRTISRPARRWLVRPGALPLLRGALKSPKPAYKLWSFATLSNGEFVGHEAYFRGDDGSPIELPESAVPQEFREWNVRVHGYDENYSEILDGTLLRAKRQLIDPKVGCQEDAVSAQPHEHTVELGQTRDNFALPSGCLTALLTAEKRTAPVQRLLFSIVYRDERERRRVQVEFDAHLEDDAKPFGDQIIMRREMYDQPYNGGQQLIGCGGKVESFVSYPRKLYLPSPERTDIREHKGELSFDAVTPYDPEFTVEMDQVRCVSLPANAAVRRYLMPKREIVVYETAVLLGETEARGRLSVTLARLYDRFTNACILHKLYVEHDPPVPDSSG
ncbi:hypothetical protein CDCA_CDCA07G2102 [Cyanidium caldarium]|uniref:Uncharacterized protein n=1 Tax=Cyanidium caldarium TaxID=2771 RepID=A0AAV9IUY6_CYACA|nr:hypothetical protein CDCA_CDCA07G2102 [Cyanidium caldarium]